MISPNSIERVKNAIDIIDVVGDFVKLKKKGSNYTGNCPFHNEKTPSFYVSQPKEIYKCFGCGKSGNAITFLMEHEKLAYADAIRWLANRYHIELEETETSPEQKQQALVTESLYAINQFAVGFFEEQLMGSEEGKLIAFSYLKERGFKNETIKKFKLGYSPNQRETLSNLLISSQFSKEIIARSGLAVLRDNGSLTDNYRGRIIFPIQGSTGKTIGFGARVIGKAINAPKYINTPENELYSKSKTLYGMYIAKGAIGKNDECLLVEGYTDVISLHQAGIENVVASGGTSLTNDQLRLIKKYSQNLTIIYDGDKAGINAALRGLDMAVEEGLEVRLVLIPDGDDPDSYVNKLGTTAFLEFISKNKKDFILFQVEALLKDAGNDIQLKNKAVNQVANTIGKINKAEDFVKRQEYIKQCAALLKIDEQGLLTLVNKKIESERMVKASVRPSPKPENPLLVEGGESIPTPIDEAAQTVNASTVDELIGGSFHDTLEENIVKLLLEQGAKAFNETQTVAAHIFETLIDFPMESAFLNGFVEKYRTQVENNVAPSIKDYVYDEDENVRRFIERITLESHELSPKWDEMYEGKKLSSTDNYLEDVNNCLCHFKLRKLKRMIEENQAEMASADEAGLLFHISVHVELKSKEKEITQSLGTVIL